MAAIPLELPPHLQQALRVKNAAGVKMPDPEGWNAAHPLYRPQKQGVAFLYLAQRVLLADGVGCGKTRSALGLVQLLKARGEPHKTLVLTDKREVQKQWSDEAHKLTNLATVSVFGDKPYRVAAYGGWFDVCISTYPLLLRDYEYLKEIGWDVLICDESSYIRHHDIQTRQKVAFLAAKIPRFICMDATPIQDQLQDIHSIMEIIDPNILGTLTAFELKYVRREMVKVRRGDRFLQQSRIIGYKNIREFKRRIDPYVLRRPYGDMEEYLPKIADPETIYFTLPLAQRKVYDQARSGIVSLWDSKDGRQRQKVKAHFHHLLQACDTTASFGDPSPTSVKIDWLIRTLKFDFRGQKVVCFARYKSTITDVMRRLRIAGIGAVRFTGDEEEAERAAAIRRFWEDASCQVIIGTTALERGLNLQKSAHLIMLSPVFNPARVIQRVGRIRRLGSEHAKVTVTSLVASETVESRLFDLLSERAAVPDEIFDETSELFDKLPMEQLVDLLRA